MGQSKDLIHESIFSDSSGIRIKGNCYIVIKKTLEQSQWNAKTFLTRYRKITL